MGIENVVSHLPTYGNVLAQHLSGINRLALVTTLFKPADSLIVANEMAAEIAKVSLPSYDVTDFTLQLNARAPVPSLPGMQMNRVLKFGVLTFQTVLMEIGAAGIMPTNRQSYASSLQIDINTVAQIQPISKDDQVNIWGDLGKEMVALRAAGTFEGLWR